LKDLPDLIVDYLQFVDLTDFKAKLITLTFQIAFNYYLLCLRNF